MLTLEGYGPEACSGSSKAVREHSSTVGNAKSNASTTTRKTSISMEESIMIPKMLDLLIIEFYLNSEEKEKCSSCTETECLKKSVFHSKKQPLIKFENYIQRILQKFGCSNAVFYMSFFYFDRLVQANNFCHFHLNIHKLFFVAIMLAYKYLEDCEHHCEFYASVAGISPKELQVLEREFLKNIGWKLYVDTETFVRLRNNMVNLYKMTIFNC